MNQQLNTELTHPNNELKLTGCITLIEQNYWSFVVFLQHKTGEIIINNSYN